MWFFLRPNVDKMRRRGDVKGLVRALWDKDSDVRRKAAEALGQIGDARAVEPLIAALWDKDWRVRREAAEALDSLGWEPANDAERALYFMAKEEYEKCVQIGKPAMDVLLGALRHEEWDVRRGAALALGEIGDARAVEPLVAALRDESWYVRLEAARALGQIGDARAVEPLIAALRDKDSDVRQKAAEALGQIGDARAVEPLIAALRHEEWYVRRVAAEALGQIGDARAVEPLVAASRDEEWYVREGAVEALGQIGDARAVEPLIGALRDESWCVREGAARALDSLGWEPANDAERALYFMAKGEYEKCVQIGNPAVEALLVALQDENSGVRRKAAEALVTMYGSGRLDDAHRASIPAQRAVIPQPHEDGGCEHSDEGIGVDFPL